MARYFFDVIEASEISDDHGIVLSNDQAAKQYAVMMLGRILLEEPQAFLNAGRIRLGVTTSDGTTLFALEMSGETLQAVSRPADNVLPLFPTRTAATQVRPLPTPAAAPILARAK